VYIFYFARQTKFHTHYRHCTCRYLQDMAALLPYNNTQAASVQFIFTVKWFRRPCIQFSLAYLQHLNSRALCAN